MPEKVLFVDLENIQKFDLSLVPADARVMIFYGATQKKLPEELVIQAQPLGARLKWLKISGQGSNALDFHIAFYLGQELANRPISHCVILSRDTGFDPLTRHLQALGCACRRVSSLNDAFPLEKTAAPDHLARLVTLLRKEKVHPIRRKGLAGKVKSWFPQLAEEARLALIQRLFDQSYVREEAKSLTYRL